MSIRLSVSTVSMSKSLPFLTIQFSMRTQFKCKFNCQKHFYFKPFSLVKQFQLNNTVQHKYAVLHI